MQLRYNYSQSTVFQQNAKIVLHDNFLRASYTIVFSLLTQESVDHFG